MSVSVLSSADRRRVLELALKQNTIHQIAERYCVSYDRVRRLIERAEERGDVPAGTLQRCGVIPRQSKARSA